MVNRVSSPRVPGSEHIPFNPINPHGSRAKMPVGWQSPFREQLFQVFVEDRSKGCIPIGPKISLNVASEVCALTTIAIKSGRIHDWANPHVLPAT
jgi:hypothetical protein